MSRLLIVPLLLWAAAGTEGDDAEEPTVRVERTTASQDLAFVRIRCDRSHVYPTQQFTITVTVAIRELPEPFQDRDPLDVFRDGVVLPPRLRLPWVDSEQIPAGIVPLAPGETWLEPLRSKDLSGLRINQLGERSVQAVLENRAVTFHPPARKVVHPDLNGIEKRYWQYEFSQHFRAQQIGEYTFGPVTLEGDVAAASDPQKGLVYETVSTTAPSMSVVVQQLPEAGKPASYLGALGRFEVEASLSSPRVKLGDPLFLKLRVHGQGSLTEVLAPDLSRLPEVARNFRVYEASQVTGTDEVRFTYPIRPLHVETKEFPAVPISYFDLEQEKYVVLHSPSLALEILPAARLAPEQIVFASDAAQPTEALAAGREGLFGNLASMSSLRNDSPHLRPWGMALAGLASCYLAAAAITTRMRRRRQDRPAARRRAAPAEARRLWREAQSHWQAGRAQAAAAQAQKALVSLVAGSLGLVAAGMTGRELCSRLTQRGIDPGLVAEVRQLLEACEAAQFGGARQPQEAPIRPSPDLLDRLIHALKHSGRRR